MVDLILDNRIATLPHVSRPSKSGSGPSFGKPAPTEWSSLAPQRRNRYVTSSPGSPVDPHAPGDHTEALTAEDDVAFGSFADQLGKAATSGDRSSRQTTRGLPLARLIPPTERGQTHYAITTMDIWGRLADRSSLRLLQWRPGHPVGVSVVDTAVIVVTRQREGPTSVTRQGHLRLPASVRHQVRLDAGDRLLLVACPDRGLLVAYPTFVLDTMVLAYHATLASRDR